MSFEKKTWSDRVSEYPTRRNLIKADGTSELVTVERSEGTVSAEGDAFSAGNMNDMEARIADAFGVLLAGDGTEFRFGVNEQGEYGYVVEVDGADTVIPFSNKEKILSALQYSGLDITEESTWDEIYSKLEDRFPNQMVIYDSGTFGSGITRLTNGRDFNSSETAGYLVIYIPDAEGGSNSRSFLEEKSDNLQWVLSGGSNASLVSDSKVDVTSYKTIKITASISDTDSMYTKGVLYTLNSGTDSNAIMFDLNTDADISNVKGSYYVGLYCHNRNSGDKMLNITNITLTA